MPRDRVAALFILVVGVIVIGTAVGFDSEASAEPVAQNFLLAWQGQDYMGAGALTTAPSNTVAAALRSTFGQLDATALFLAMDSVTQHGATAEATFTATVDLAEQNRVWTYQGKFGLVKKGSDWRVAWSPSVIHPQLGAGERLAVVTTFPDRGLILDSDGEPLQSSATVDVVGVVPGKLANAQATATQFAAATGVQATEVSGQIAAAPPSAFLKLATLDPDTFQQLRPKLQGIPGLVVKTERQVLYKANATGLVGQVGSEVDRQLQAEGTLYLPGTTIGLSGLEHVYQRQLLGSPSTSIVDLNSAGDVVATLKQWPGVPGSSVRTTINSAVQRAALSALDSVSQSGELIAVQASTGDVLAVAQHSGSTALPPGGLLNARLSPGTAFTIVSTEALLQSGLAENTPISCDNSFTVGGQTFTSYGSGAQRPFSTEFANDCGTAFAGLSERLTPGQFTQVVKAFGLGGNWAGPLQVPAFTGSVPVASDQADLAAETIGKGNVLVSPLAMALVAAQVDSGSWHAPSVLADTGQAGPVPSAQLDQGSLSSLRDLMRGAVKSGAAKAANVSGAGAPVCGQVGLTHTSTGWLSWFVGYRGDVAFALIEAGSTPRLSAAALAGAFVSTLGNTALSNTALSGATLSG